MAQDAPTLRRPVLAAGLFLVGVIAFGWVLFSRPVIAPGREVTLTGPTMGTTFTVKIAVPERGIKEERIGEIASGIEALLEDINAKMSTYDPSSELSRFNASESTEPFALSPDTYSVISAAQTISEETGGAFDITVGPLVNAWGFGPDDHKPQGPGDDALAELRASVGYTKITLGDNTITKSDAAVEADLSAIAKGYAVDRVSDYLASMGYVDTMVEIGGEVRAVGVNSADLPWRIGVKQPVHGGAPTEVVKLSGRAMATSGDYENYYEVDGYRISHTIDPASGKPITHTLASVTVLHNECMYADAYATAINVIGPERGLAFAEEKGLATMLIVRTAPDEFEIIMSSAWPKE